MAIEHAKLHNKSRDWVSSVDLGSPHEDADVIWVWPDGKQFYGFLVQVADTRAGMVHPSFDIRAISPVHTKKLNEIIDIDGLLAHHDIVESYGDTFAFADFHLGHRRSVFADLIITHLVVEDYNPK